MCDAPTLRKIQLVFGSQLHKSRTKGVEEISNKVAAERSKANSSLEIIKELTFQPD